MSFVMLNGLLILISICNASNQQHLHRFNFLNCHTRIPLARHRPKQRSADAMAHGRGKRHGIRIHFRHGDGQYNAVVIFGHHVVTSWFRRYYYTMAPRGPPTMKTEDFYKLPCLDSCCSASFPRPKDQREEEEDFTKQFSVQRLRFMTSASHCSRPLVLCSFKWNSF